MSIRETTEQQELKRRIDELEDPSNQGKGFTKGDWGWLIFLGIIFPVALLIWGWF